jgi:hypothetical protein
MNDNPKPPLDLDKLDASLIEDLKQQVKDGLITQDEADKLAAMIKPTSK